jgi:hypothetical protein
MWDDFTRQMDDGACRQQCVPAHHILLTSAPGLRSPLPDLHQDCVQLCHICAGTGHTPATSALGLDTCLAHWDSRMCWWRSCLQRAECTGTGLSRTALSRTALSGMGLRGTALSGTAPQWDGATWDGAKWDGAKWDGCRSCAKRAECAGFSSPGCAPAVRPLRSPPLRSAPLSHLHRELGSPSHIFAGTGLTPAHICAGTGPTPAHICAGTALVRPADHTVVLSLARSEHTPPRPLASPRPRMT